MKRDKKENTPGTAEYWDTFYSPEGVVGSQADLIPRYEWFMPFTAYWPHVGPWTLPSGVQFSSLSSGGASGGKSGKDKNHPPAFLGKVYRILHVGCGNSAFSDDLDEVTIKARDKGHCPSFEVVNMDICDSIMTDMANRYPKRLYAVGDVCNLRPPPMQQRMGSSWWGVGPGGANGAQQLFVEDSSVDCIFDKGTLDALLSAFAGRRGDGSNPNALAYCRESLRALKKPSAAGNDGGRIVLLSINAREVVEPYFYMASTTFGSDDDEHQDDASDEDEGFEADCSDFGFKLVHAGEVEYDRKEEDPDLGWIHSYGTHYTLFVFEVEDNA